MFQTTELHLLEPEKVKDFALQFLPLRKAGNHILKSTLLRPDSPHASELPKKLVPRMLVYDDIRRVWLPLKKKVEPVTAAAEASQSSGIWEKFRFRSLGVGFDVFGHLTAHNKDFSSLFLSEDGGQENSILPPAKVEQVREWQQQVENNDLEELTELPPIQSDLSIAKSSTSEKGEEASVTEDLTSDVGPRATTTVQYEPRPAVEKLSPKKRAGMVRRPKITKAAGVLNSEMEHESVEQPMTIDQPLTTNCNIASDIAANPRSALNQQQSHTSIRSAENIQSQESATEPSSRNLEDLRELMQPDLNSFQLFNSLISPLKSPDQSLVAHPEEFSIQHQASEGLFDLSRPISAQSSRPPARSPSHVSSVAGNACAVKPVSLVDSGGDHDNSRYMSPLPALPPSTSTLSLAAKDESEPTSRFEGDQLTQSGKDLFDGKLNKRYVSAVGSNNNEGPAEESPSAGSTRSATLQKAASCKETSDTKLNEIGIGILAKARVFNGDIRLAIEIGRILLSGVPTQYTNSPFAATEWNNVFTGGDGSSIPRTTFTNM